MKITYTFIISFCFIIFTLLISCNNQENKVVGKPNVVIIMADDMGYSDLGCYGGEISTPNLDRLANGGIRFKKIYNCARCCPTRASLLTGLYPHNAGVGKMTLPAGKEEKEGPFQGYLGKNTVTIAEALKSAGYKSYLSGKWHVGEGIDNWPLQRGFDRYFGLISGASSYFELIKNQRRIRQMAIDNSPWEPTTSDFYMTDAITNYAIDRIRENSNNNPFFLYVAYTAPHWPLHALQEDIDKYAGKYDIGWDSIRINRFNKLQKIGLIKESTKLPEMPKHIPAWEKVHDKKQWAAKMEVYASMIDRMDQGIGRIINELKEQGKYENTLFIFLSDNGASDEDVEYRGLNNPSVPVGLKGSYVSYKEPWANVSNTPYRYYKKRIYEGGIASPFIIHWPKKIKEEGIIIDQLAHVSDIMPTILDAANINYPLKRDEFKTVPMDGISLLPRIIGNNTVNKGEIYWEHYGNRAIVEGYWKMVKNSDENWKLFNMKEDITESNDLSSQHPDVFKNLKEKHSNWEKEVGIYTSNKKLQEN